MSDSPVPQGPNAFIKLNDEARKLALQAISKRSQTDLYYLCKHILGYESMTIPTHQELCTLTETLRPRSTRLT